MKKIDSRTVSNRIAHRFWMDANQAGISEAEFFRHTGIAQAELRDPGGRVNTDKHRRMLTFMGSFPTSRAIVDVGAEQWLGEHLTLAGICYNSDSLRRALRHFLAFRGLIGEFDFMTMRENGSEVEVDYLTEFANARSGVQAFANFKTLAYFIRAYDAGTGAVLRVGLQGAAPSFAGAMGEFFGAPVRFEQARNTMRFAAAALDRPFQHFNAVLAPYSLARAQQEMARISGAHAFSSKVEGAIRDLLMAPGDNADGASLLLRLCERLAVTPWSLRRMLRQEESSFSALERKVKSEEARALLLAGALSVADVSDRLGFSSQSAFTRFFKLHHHLPPALYRQNAVPAGRS